MRRARRPPRRRRRAGARSIRTRDRTARTLSRRDAISRHRANDAAYSALILLRLLRRFRQPRAPIGAPTSRRASSPAPSPRAPPARSPRAARRARAPCAAPARGVARPGPRIPRGPPREERARARPSTAASSSELGDRAKVVVEALDAPGREGGRKKSPRRRPRRRRRDRRRDGRLFARVGDAGDRRVGRLGVAEWIRLLRVPGLPGLEWVRLDITARVGLRVGGLGLRRGERSRFRRRRIRRIAVILPGIAIGGRRGIIARPGGRVGVVRFFLHSGVRHGCLRVLLGRLGGRVASAAGDGDAAESSSSPFASSSARNRSDRDILRRSSLAPSRAQTPAWSSASSKEAPARRPPRAGGRGRIRHAARCRMTHGRRLEDRSVMVPNEAAFEC